MIMEAYPMIEVYNQRKAVAPEESPIFASGIFCSSMRTAIDLMTSIEHVVGVEGNGLPK